VSQTTCSIDGCERPSRARKMCRMHYLRWHKTGDPGHAETRVTANGSGCSVNGCSNPAKRRGFCDMHYRRWLKHGDPGSTERLLHRNPDQCQMPECGRPPKAHGLCEMHYVRQGKHGDPERVDKTTGNYRGDNIGYTGIHMRIRSLRGPATQHSCRHCGDGAEHWAYDHGDPNAHRDDAGRLYSTDAIHCIPLCVPCHRRLDGLP
jgi:hypothetical protein